MGSWKSNYRHLPSRRFRSPYGGNCNDHASLTVARLAGGTWKNPMCRYPVPAVQRKRDGYCGVRFRRVRALETTRRGKSQEYRSFEPEKRRRKRTERKAM